MVSATPNNPGLAAGDIIDHTGSTKFPIVVSSAVYSKGQVLVKDTGVTPHSYKLVSAAANLQGPFVMIYLDPGTAATTTLHVVKGGVWAVTADGDIHPVDDVVMSSSTDGQVVAGSFPTVATTPTGGEVTIQAKYFTTLVGRSGGLADAYRTTSRVKAVDGDLVAVDANEGYGGA